MDVDKLSSVNSLSGFEERLDGLTIYINKLKSISDEDFVKHGGLGLHSKKEGISWLAINSLGERGRLVVDFYNLTEYVQHVIVGPDTI